MSEGEFKYDNYEEDFENNSSYQQVQQPDQNQITVLANVSTKSQEEN